MRPDNATLNAGSGSNPKPMELPMVTKPAPTTTMPMITRAQPRVANIPATAANPTQPIAAASAKSSRPANVISVREPDRPDTSGTLALAHGSANAAITISPDATNPTKAKRYEYPGRRPAPGT